MEQEVYVNHWRYDDGWHNIPSILRKDQTGPSQEFIEHIIGWHCWVYCNDHNEFIDWMQDHCPTADCTARFNSGNPMITIHIKDKDEAAYFMLSFQVA